MRRLRVSTILKIIVIFLNMATFSIACNEAICGSIVTKCMLIEKCNCEMKANSSCFKECSVCLDDLYDECCSCFEFCPKPKVTKTHLQESSQVEELEEPIPTLFKSLTCDPDPEERWISFTFPVKVHRGYNFSPSMKKNYDRVNLVETFDNDVQNRKEPEEIIENCTVAYISKCIPSNKCKISCSSMGAASYRWFHDGCCECVGQICIKYGLNESRCSKCPDTGNTNEETILNYDDYGQYDDDYEDYD